MDYALSYEVRKDGLVEKAKSLIGLNHIRPVSRRLLGDWEKGYGYYRTSSFGDMPEIGAVINTYVTHLGFKSNRIQVKRIDEKGYGEESMFDEHRVPIVYVKPVKK